jgi:division protein CdvB (Snf7/Vps24/ESCRT-III family)/predicted CopG family antitoxin
VTKSIQTLKIQHNKLEQATYRLKERDKYLLRLCVSSLENKNKQRAVVCANEIAEIRKLVRFLCGVQIAIERVIIRLETIRELNEIVVDLKPSLKLLQNVSQELFQILPEVSSELGKVNETISETLHSTKISADEPVIPVDMKTPGGEKIMNEVSRFLEQRLSEDLPEPPLTLKAPETEKSTIKEMIALSTSYSEKSCHKSVEESGKESSQTLLSFKKAEIKEISLKVENPQFEDVLLDYVKRSKGQIDLARCSAELETSHEEIEKALKNLDSQGRIKIEVETGE